MLLTITREDIEAGVRRDDKYCPFALACKRAGVLACSYEYPEILFDFQQRFDNGEPVSPITFEYEPWDGVINHEQAITQRALVGV